MGVPHVFAILLRVFVLPGAAFAAQNLAIRAQLLSFSPAGTRLAHGLAFIHIGTRKVSLRPPTDHPNAR